MKQSIVIFVTTGSEDEARQIADALLEKRTAACVNIIPAVKSQFWWQGSIDRAVESLLIIKTRADLLQEAISVVKSKHSYQVPEIIALPVIGGNTGYLDWIEKETA